MCTIAESNVFLRAEAELPAGLKMATEEFHEGWKRMRSGGKSRLRKRVQTRGWNFIEIAGAALRSGVGAASQEAIASALKLALRQVNAHSNAVEVGPIELTQYPWFFLARVRVTPYRIQQEAPPPALAHSEPAQPVAQPRRLPPESTALFPRFGSAMPMLKQMLVASQSVAMRTE